MAPNISQHIMPSTLGAPHSGQAGSCGCVCSLICSLYHSIALSSTGQPPPPSHARWRYTACISLPSKQFCHNPRLSVLFYRRCTLEFSRNRHRQQARYQHAYEIARQNWARRPLLCATARAAAPRERSADRPCRHDQRQHHRRRAERRRRLLAARGRARSQPGYPRR